MYTELQMHLFNNTTHYKFDNQSTINNYPKKLQFKHQKLIRLHDIAIKFKQFI